MQKKISRTVETNNYGYFEIAKFFFFATLLIWIFYHIGLKYWSAYNFIVMTLLLLFFSSVAILNMASLQIQENEITIKHKIRKSRDRGFMLDEIYLTIYNPPSASWSQELVQIRLNKNDKILYQFGKDTESRNNKPIYLLLVKKGIKTKKLVL